MEEWQGCLSPLCQRALVQAREDVRARDGYAITVEDFLLALLLGEAAIGSFLRRHGVDMDELIRTVQCEQPIVTAIGAEGALSSQLQYWISQTLEVTGFHWVEWQDLLATLAHSCDRLAQKAYVAVLEQVRHWHHPSAAGGPVPGNARPQGLQPPFIITIDVREQTRLADDLAVLLASEPNALVWLNGPTGIGKTSLLRHQLSKWPLPSLWLDLRAQREVMECSAPVLPSQKEADGSMPTLVLDNTSPHDLLMLMSDPAQIASALIPSYSGPLLLASGVDDRDMASQLAAYTGRRLYPVSMPASSYGSRLAILRIHQPVIERKWAVQINEDALLTAAMGKGRTLETPGNSIRWLEAAAARTALLANQGDLETRELSGRIADMQRQILTSQSRGDDVAFLELRLAELELERAASEVDWLEREAQGLLRQVTRDRVCPEIRRWALEDQAELVSVDVSPCVNGDVPHVVG